MIRGILDPTFDYTLYRIHYSTAPHTKTRTGGQNNNQIFFEKYEFCWQLRWAKKEKVHISISGGGFQLSLVGWVYFSKLHDRLLVSSISLDLTHFRPWRWESKFETEHFIRFMKEKAVYTNLCRILLAVCLLLMLNSLKCLPLIKLDCPGGCDCDETFENLSSENREFKSWPFHQLHTFLNAKFFDVSVFFQYSISNSI